jgi:hypothetical protein
LGVKRRGVNVLGFIFEKRKHTNNNLTRPHILRTHIFSVPPGLDFLVSRAHPIHARPRVPKHAPK